MPQTLSKLASEYVQSVNQKSVGRFLSCFAPNAVVDDAGRKLEGIAAIREWAEREIFAANVSFEVLETADHNGETIVTAKIDGTFDKTGLPDPLVMSHRITVEEDKIVAIVIQFAGATPAG